MDDLGDYRPGLRAVEELSVKSPLREAGLHKSEIRALSKELGLPTWEKPSFACLASRFVYGETITEEKLAMVDKAEELLLSLGFRQVRVRIHGTIARIEVMSDEFEKLNMYKRISAITDSADMEDLHQELEERFGKVPQVTDNLMSVAYIKAKAHECFITEITGTDPEPWVSYAKQFTKKRPAKAYKISLLMPLPQLARLP